MGRFGEAIDLYRQAAARAPDYAEIHNNLGNALLAAGRTEEAVASLTRAAKLKPSLAGVHTNLGLALAALGRFDDAAASHRAALKLHPGLAMAHNNLGVALQKSGKLDEAIASFRRAIELDPRLPEALVNLADTLGSMKPLGESPGDPRRNARVEEAMTHYRRAIELRPDYADAYINLGGLSSELRQFAEAEACLRRARDLNPADGQAIIGHITTRREMCEWDDPAQDEAAIVRAAQTVQRGAFAFTFLTIVDNPELQLKAARREVQIRLGAGKSPLLHKMRRRPKIRLGYLSADFCDHATAYLLAELIENHDRSRFEVHAFSFGPDDGSAIRHRLQHAFDSFSELGGLSDADAAQQVYRAEIDIAIDLKGYTKESRPGILSYRPAPVQAAYLGYPGTMGADFIDYCIADKFVAPDETARHFSERLVYLPDSYQVNDTKRQIAERTPSRTDCGLPAEGFVFCSFNNNYKITRPVFEAWMRILKGVPKSVLWLLADNEWAVANLRREAGQHDVDPGRLIFAPRVKHADHLARHRLAGLFLDTAPVNAHTTASDALWAGLPLLTCAGESFVARVAGSLLHAAGMPELVTASLADYEALALKLASEPEHLSALRAKLQRNRMTGPLFDIDRFRRHIEAAYIRMWSIWQQGGQPEPFAIEPVDPAVQGS